MLKQIEQSLSSHTAAPRGFEIGIVRAKEGVVRLAVLHAVLINLIVWTNGGTNVIAPGFIVEFVSASHLIQIKRRYDIVRMKVMRLISRRAWSNPRR